MQTALNNKNTINNSNAPSLEDFGLNFSVYADFRKRYGKIIKNTEENIFINAIIIFLWIAVGVGIYYLLFNLFEIPKNDWSIFIFIYLILVIALIIINDDKWEIKSFVSNFVRNLFTNGKYLIAIKERTKVQNRVRAFEEIYCLHYQKKIDYFFEENINRKRRRLYESLDEFSLMLDKALKINDIFLTNHLYINSHIEYIKKRLGHFSPQKYLENKTKHDKNLDNLNEYKVNDVIRQEKIQLGKFGDIDDAVFSENRNENISILPEEKYRIPKKINWEEINKIKARIGLQGEEIIFELEKNYLKEIGRSDLSEKVRHISKDEGDGLGYDILSFFSDGREKYIEVKSTKSKIESQFNISRNELNFIKNNLQTSFIYRVQIIDNTEPELLAIGGEEFLNKMEVVPVSFVARNKF